MSKIIIVPIEPLETRYTKQWYIYLPEQLNHFVRSKDRDIQIYSISGEKVGDSTTEGAFLNFGATNVYKSSQLNIISKHVKDGFITDGDYILFTDAWNPSVINIRYMIDLLGINVNIGGMWHAGSYDPNDFLGRSSGGKPWATNTEKALFHSYDHNFFATKYHIDLFCQNLEIIDGQNKIFQVGWPMEYLENEIRNDVPKIRKIKSIIFPHRMSEEKNYHIFERMKELDNKGIEFLTCQDKKLSKKEYHQMLSESNVLFSANEQETLGISWYEGLLLDVIPMVPDDLSYKEMAIEEFKYDPKYRKDPEYLLHHVYDMINQSNIYKEQSYKLIDKQINKMEDFFNGKRLYEIVVDSI